MRISDKKRKERTLIPSKLVTQVERDLRQGGTLSEHLPGYEQRPSQIELACQIASAIDSGTTLLSEAPTGIGKALDVDTPIPTPTGWKRIGDLIEGDLVFDEQGQPTRVTVAFDIMYNRPCYEVVFSDGSTLVADAEHEWVSYTVTDRGWAKRPKSPVYQTKNFVTNHKLAFLDQLILSSCPEDRCSIREATTLLQGHEGSICQAATSLVQVNPPEETVRYSHQQTLLALVRDRLAKDLREQRRDSQPCTLVTTEQMVATLTVHASKRANHAIAVACALTLPDADLPLTPYFLGVWLGDGTSSSNEITTADPELITERKKEGYTARKRNGSSICYARDDEHGKAQNRWQPCLRAHLRKLGVLNNKHIPSSYLRASEQQRRALLAGLLDTDGTVNNRGAAEFTTTNPRLAQDVYELICSLGFRCSLSQGIARCNGKDCGSKWRLSFTTNQQVFRLERKVLAHRTRLRNYCPDRNRFRYVVAIREVPSRPVRCIQVNAPSHLYLAGQSMIPTHNSHAYLIPAVRSGKVAIVSTANKALQEQLFFKDIPFLQQHLCPFEAALLKGISNYLCLDRFDEEQRLQVYLPDRQFPELLTTLKDPTFDGDLEQLPFLLDPDLSRRVRGESELCAWSKCDWYKPCYVRQVKEQAENSQIIVVNHTLLLLDVLAGGKLLPERDVIILDEAHHLPEEATQVFTIRVTHHEIANLLLRRSIRSHTTTKHRDEVSSLSWQTWEALDARLEKAPQGKPLTLTESIESGLQLSSAVMRLHSDLLENKPPFHSEREEALYRKVMESTAELSEAIRLVFAVDDTETVYYMQRQSTKAGNALPIEVCASPLNVAPILERLLFGKWPTILTSATLASTSSSSQEPNFDFFRKLVGLSDPDRVQHELILPPTFDYAACAQLYVPRPDMMPEPAYGQGPLVDAYVQAMTEQMERLVRAAGGHAFLLFSSKRMLEAVYTDLGARLPYRVLRQGELLRLELLRQFRETSSVLFGLKSFWEGVDIPGSALTLVVIDKMPFDPPDDPVHAARVERMKTQGEDWFGGYVLPQAVLRLKQGVGRLIRSRTDYGVMALLDSRLHVKGYKRRVIQALPPAQKVANLALVEQFYTRRQEEKSSPLNGG
jgi:Rad3-related DNA helicase